MLWISSLDNTWLLACCYFHISVVKGNNSYQCLTQEILLRFLTKSSWLFGYLSMSNCNLISKVSFIRQHFNHEDNSASLIIQQNNPNGYTYHHCSLINTFQNVKSLTINSCQIIKAIWSFLNSNVAIAGILFVEWRKANPFHLHFVNHLLCRN